MCSSDLTKETQYIVIAVLGAYLLTQVWSEIKEWIYARRSLAEFSPTASFFVLLTVLSLPLLAASVAIFQKDLWPKQIVVNGSVLMDGKKMSKTYGNIIPLKSAVAKYGADPLRLTILGAAELLADADISLNLVTTFSERIERFYKNVINLKDLKLNSDKIDLTNEDIWIS